MKKIILHIQRSEFEGEDCTMLAIHDLIKSAGGMRGEHYYQDGDKIIPLDAGWKLLDQVFRNNELSAARDSLIRH
ncbi:hypothetical protein H6G64_31725 [Calothrix sp. FACHB-156]|nr:hypothetical protein [Calothrix sp. FACHB-156]